LLCRRVVPCERQSEEHIFDRRTESQVLRKSVLDKNGTNIHLLPLLIFIPAVIGLAFQNASKKKPAKKAE
jgi:hypothetical protein